jgi:hypothetical protein
MFLNSSLYLIFIFLIYNIIKFDEEFLIMVTIFISFSIILDILFKNITESYNNFFLITKNAYLKLILILKLMAKKLFKSYKGQRRLKRKVIYFSYKIKTKMCFILNNLNLNNLNLIKLFSLSFFVFHLNNLLFKDIIFQKQAFKELLTSYNTIDTGVMGFEPTTFDSTSQHSNH